MTAALFSIQCPTCRRRLKVQHQAAIGQILPCPKCGSLLQVVPPENWRPSADELPDTLASGVMPPRGGDSLLPNGSGSPGPWSEPIADDDSATSPVSEAKSTVSRRNPFAFAVLVLMLPFAGIAAYWVLTLELIPMPADNCPPDQAAEVASVATAAHEDANEAPAGNATAQPAAAVASDEAPPVASDNAPTMPVDAHAADAAPDEMPAEPESNVADNQAESNVAGSPPEPRQADDAPHEGPSDQALIPVEPEPTVIPLAIATVLPREPLPEVSAEAQWREPLVDLQIEQMPLHRFARLMSRLSACPLRIDLDSLAAAQIEVDAPVALHIRDTTLGEALEAGLSPLGLTTIEHDASATIVASRVEVAMEERSYLWSEFGEKSPEAFVERLTKLVAPDAWRAPAAVGNIPEALVVRQSPAVHREITDFVQRLGAARSSAVRKVPIDRSPSPAETLLDAEISVNFRPAQRLEVALEQLAQSGGLRLVVDGIALAEAGVSLDEPLAMSAVHEPLAEALDVALLPLGLSYRVAEPNVLEVTSWTAAARRSAPRVIDVGLLATRPEDGLVVALDYGAFAREHGRPPSTSPEAALVLFDPASKCLLVRAQHSASRKIASHVASRLDALRSP